jgi:hypothetical protein
VALGEIGDPRAFAALTDMLSWEERTNIRDEIVRGLGLLGDARAIDVLLPLLASEPGLKHTAESLVRLGAPASGALGGRDIDPSLNGKGGLFGCAAGPLQHDWDYLQRTFCLARSGSQIELPRNSAELAFAQGAILVLRMRRDDAPETVPVTLTLDAQALQVAAIDGSWQELRFDLAASALRKPRFGLRLTSPMPQATFALDHALLVAKPATLSMRASDAAKPPQDTQRIP